MKITQTPAGVKMGSSRIGAIFPLALAHMSCDLSQGALPVLLPFLVAQHNINYAAAATVVFASNMVSTVTQPFFGYISDRRSRPWLIPLGVLLAGIGFSLAGIAPTYLMVLLAVGLSGLGVATFHPEGARQANLIAGDKKATTMSLFTLGGQFGFALGPLVATGLLIGWGLKGTTFFALGSLVVAAFLVRRPLTGGRHGEKAGLNPQAIGPPTERDAWGPFLCLSTAVVCRSIIFYGLNTFLPLFWLNALGQSKAAGGTALAILVAGSMIGNILGGKIADRVGYRVAVLAEFTLLACILPFLPFTRNAGIAMALLVPIGLLLSAPSSSMVVLGQGYLPNHIGFSSGVTMGLAFSFGGIITPLIGWIADYHGLRVALGAVAFLPVACLAFVLALPRRKTTTEARPI